MKSDNQTIVIPITLIGSLVLSSCPVYAMNNNNNKMYVNNKMNVSGAYNISNYNTIEEYTVDGLDRYETAVNISKKLYSSNKNVVLAKSVDAEGNKTGLDAYTGAILAGTLDCPLLYTKTDTLNSFTKKEIQRLNVKNLYIVGGKTQISEGVEKELKNMGINVKRIQGVERYETSLDIAKEIRANKKIEEVIIVNGFNLESINASVGVANSMNAPIIYVKENHVLPEVLNYIKTNSLGVYIVGAKQTSDGLGVSSQVISQIRENARFVKVQNSSDALTINLWLNNNRNIDENSSSVSIVEKNNMVDGTFISVLSKKYNAIPLIIDKTSPISDDYKNILKEFKIKNIYRSFDSKELGYDSMYQYLYDNLNKDQFDGPVLDGTENDNIMVYPEPEMPEIPMDPIVPDTPEVPIEPAPEVPETPVEPDAPEISNNKTIEQYTVDGLDRYETAVNISKKLYSYNNNVVLAKSIDADGNETGLDAYTGAILAGTLDCPLLYTKTDTLTTFTKNEIERLKVKNIYIVGGTTQISENVEKELKNMGINVKRIKGAERYETSLDIAKEIRANKKIEEVIIVNGFNVESINASVGAANSMNAPIIYVKENHVLPEVLNYIKTNSLGVYIVGANQTSDGLGISSQVISQIKENARFVKVQNSSDSLTINLWLNNNRGISNDSNSIAIVEKNNMVDGTFISVLSKKYNAIPLIIDKTSHMSYDYKDILKELKIKNIYRSFDTIGVGYDSMYQYLYDNLNKDQFDGPVLDGTGNDNIMVDPEPSTPEIPNDPIVPDTPEVPDMPMDPVEPDTPEIPNDPEIPEIEVPQELITITQADSSYKRIKGKTTAKTKVAAYTVNKKGVEKLLGRTESDEQGYFNIKLNKKQAHDSEVILYTFSEDGEKENRMIVTMKDMTAPEQPFVTNKIKDTTTVVKGEAEAKTMIIVKDENNNIIGEGKCNIIGIFYVKIPKQEKGTKLFVYSIDLAGNESTADEIVVKG